MSKRRRKTKSRPSTPSQPRSSADDWYTIKDILDERTTKSGRLEFLVDWEGTNPDTGTPYDPSWLPADQVNAAAINDWNAQKLATSPVQADERPQKWRTDHAELLSSSQPSESQFSAHHSDQAWSAHPTRLLVEIQQNNNIDRSEYLSVQLSQTTAEGSSQPPSTQDSSANQAQPISQRTIPDSQEPDSQDTPNEPRLAVKNDLRGVLGLPRSFVSTQSSPLHESQEPPTSATTSSGGVPGDSFPNLLRRPDTNQGSSNNAPSTTFVELSDGSIPSRQPDSFPIIANSQEEPHSAAHSRHLETGLPLSASNIGTLARPRTSPNHSSSVPQFLTQPPLSLPPLPTSSTEPSHPSGSKESVVPDSTQGLFLPARNSPEQLSSQHGAADYGLAQPRDYSYPPSQVNSLNPSQDGPSLLPSARQINGLSSTEESVVPETVLRRPHPHIVAWDAVSDSSVASSESRDRREVLTIPGLSNTPRRRVAPVYEPETPTPPRMESQQPEESAAARLRRIRHDIMGPFEGSEFLEPSVPDEGTPHRQPSPALVLHHDPVLSMPSQPHTLETALRPHAEAQETENDTLFSHRGLPGEDDAMPQTDFAIPTTVNPSDVHPPSVNPAAIFQMEPSATAEPQSTSDRRLPHHGELLSGPHEHSMDTASDGGASSAEEESRGVSPVEGPGEFTVTLPFSSNRRPVYDQIIMGCRAEIEEFSGVFSNEVMRIPKASTVHKIEDMFLKLLNVCDLPPELDDSTLGRLAPEELRTYAFESNAKYAFIWELLNLVREQPMKILIVARSERIMFFLEKLMIAEGYALSRDGLRNLQEGHARWPINVVLALPEQEIPDSPSDFDLIIGFDFEFKGSAFSKRLAMQIPVQKQPMVLSLVITHSIEHLDLAIMEQDRDIPELDHKNALVVALTRIRQLILHPEMGREKPHQTAEFFAQQLKEPSGDFLWEPIPIPEDILDFYVDATQSRDGSSIKEAESGFNSRKRKMDETEETVPKRLKVSTALAPIVNVDRVNALAPIIRQLGPEALDRDDIKAEVSVPVALLKEMESKMNDQKSSLAEAKKVIKDLKSDLRELGAQNTAHVQCVVDIQSRHKEAIEERAKLELERNRTAEQNAALKEQLTVSDNEKTRLAEENAKLAEEVKKLKAALSARPAQDPSAELTSLKTASASPAPKGGDEPEGQRIAKKLEFAERDLEYARKMYQDASKAASDLGNENRELARRIKDLEHKASDSLRRIHEANAASQVASIASERDELATTLREREWELDRVREELRLVRSTRRETRQSSVPKSPRVTGVMSPRTGGRGGVASRGSSPAPVGLDGSPGVQLFGQQVGNDRWQHLRH